MSKKDLIVPITAEKSVKITRLSMIRGGERINARAFIHSNPASKDPGSDAQGGDKTAETAPISSRSRSSSK